ncbi:hypothetical protein DPEC_G00002520 [Dallia pectoralis]|uniref:Uncharacterized protein n=1 Tax=Dallia pectoralis TaxID=75939 RepID=A0ACC2HJ35_DALPE|nr:hypothetical protein DPEC_G00002520 [Dallia pectoralis]
MLLGLFPELKTDELSERHCRSILSDNFSAWCGTLTSTPLSTKLDPVPTVPRMTPYNTTCYCRSNNEGMFMGLSICTDYVSYYRFESQYTVPLEGGGWFTGSRSDPGVFSPVTLLTFKFPYTVHIHAHKSVLAPNITGAGTYTDHYWVCGDNAYVYLPQGWSGCCVFVTLNTTLKMFPIVDNHGCRMRRSESISPDSVPSEDRRSSGWEKFWRGLAPWYGTVKNAHEMDRVGYELETLVNITTEGFMVLKPEVKALRIMVLQNRMALDMILAEQGGVCRLVGKHCCTYIPDGDQNLTEVVQHLHSLYKLLTGEHVTGGSWDPFSWLKAYLGVWGSRIFHWVKYGIVILVAILMIVMCIKKMCTKAVSVVLNMPLVDLKDSDSEFDNGTDVDFPSVYPKSS